LYSEASMLASRLPPSIEKLDKLASLYVRGAILEQVAVLGTWVSGFLALADFDFSFHSN